MAQTLCLEHFQVDEPKNPCLKCVIQTIFEWTYTRDGSYKSLDRAMRSISQVCRNTLKKELIGDPEQERFVPPPSKTLKKKKLKARRHK